ncbi:hypothetical protein QYM36_009688 [Artemia franciscana]|uniref:Uncharacterized protein n=1 Tax=Artemia franciscana TaxID=6661 RepID=A0AA88HP37_ARTSF|nr:hypothetical protein QYM36_009688 [Artemia franciscana]
MVIVEKKDGGMRLCIDPVDLIMVINDPHYIVPTFEDAVVISLSVRSPYYTTLSAIYGRYRWKRYPFGLVYAQDKFQRKIEEAFIGLKGIRILEDDILYITDLSSKNMPLRDLTKTVKLRWEVNHESCMKEIKSCLSGSLAFFDHGYKTVEVKVDASKYELGAKLS